MTFFTSSPRPLYVYMGLYGCNEASAGPGVWNSQGYSDLVYSPANVLRGSNLATFGGMSMLQTHHGCLVGDGG
ncbi:hypothetical protein ACSS6W_006552 [Trichoderma asperelloides]